MAPSKKQDQQDSTTISCKIITLVFLFFSLPIFVIFAYSNYSSIAFTFNKITNCHREIAPSNNFSTPSSTINNFPTCDPQIAPFYIYDLPYRFNGLITEDCTKIHPSIYFCSVMVNNGFGQPNRRPNWYTTNQFTLELIFHARASNHPCRTYDPKKARLFFIPFYVCLYTTYMYKAPNDTVRDAMAFDLVDHLSNFSSFHRRGGNDHFIVGSCNVDDITRPENYTYWYPATRLLQLPKFSNVSLLIFEREPWNSNGTHFGIPYASYFHPTSASELTAWQEEIRRSERNHLFAFIGGGRPSINKSSVIRSILLKLCRSTTRCLLMDCSENQILCEYDSDWVMGILKRAHFCLQPRGDSWTRRSVFDSILAACIPVFYSENTAYNQYDWYIPKKREDWSVFIADDKIDQTEQILGEIPMEKVEKMRQVLIEMIPYVTYVDPNATQIGFHDAVDVALIELTKRVDGLSI